MPSVSVRKLTSRRAPGSRTTQIEHLEGKIEDLITLLRNQTFDKPNNHTVPDNIGLRTPTPSTHSPYYENVNDESPAGTGVESSASNSNAFVPGVAPVTASKPNDHVASSTNVYNVSHFDKPSILKSAAEPNPLQAEESLSFFRKHMLGFFPVVYLAPDVTAKQVREWSPFFWFNIMAATAKTPGQQFAMTDSIKRFVAQKPVIDN